MGCVAVHHLASPCRSDTGQGVWQSITWSSPADLTQGTDEGVWQSITWPPPADLALGVAGTVAQTAWWSG